MISRADMILSPARLRDIMYPLSSGVFSALVQGISWPGSSSGELTESLVVISLFFTWSLLFLHHTFSGP
jgi:hypothetical protein